MNEVLLNVHGIRIRVQCGSAEQRALLLRDYGPFEVGDFEGAAARLTVTAGLEGRAGGDAKAVAVDGLLGDRILLSNTEISISGPSATGEAAYFKELRAYLTATLISIVQKDFGGVDLHASCVRPPGGGAVVFTGSKKAGKSSMALAMVDHGWSYLANEMTMLWSDQGRIVVATLPQALAIAPGAQAWFARNAARVRVATPAVLPDSTDQEDIYAFEHGEKLRVERDEVLHTIDESETYRHPIQTMIFVEPAVLLDEPRLRRISPDEAAIRMLENVEYYLRWGQEPSQPAATLIERTGSLIRQVSASVDAYHLQWCPDHRKNAAAVERAVGGFEQADPK